jgi:hypothetical protein
MKNGLYTLAIIITGIITTSTVVADVKIKAKQTMSGQSYENTTYIKGKRQRAESMNGMMVSLIQCDLRRGLQLNTQTKTYVVNPFDATSSATTTKTTAVVDKNGVVQAGGRVTTTIALRDTGVRKQMFGFTARHLIITMETISSPDACSKTNTKMQTDGWYIDAEFVLDCDYAQQNYRNSSPKNAGCRDTYEMKTVASTKRGYPVYEKMTMFDESGKETYSMVSEVVELSKATLDASLFEVPADYREVDDASEMYASASTTNSRAAAITSNGSATSGAAQSVRMAAQPAPLPASSNREAKRPGTIRIGLAGVKTGAVGDGIAATELAAAIENTLTAYLKVPDVEVIRLEAKLASSIAAEARAAECDYVIHATVSHKKGGGGGFGGMFGQALGSAIGRTGIGHTGSTAGNIAGQVATNAVVSATTVSSNVRSKDEIALDIKVDTVEGVSALAKIYKVKARSNGDDIISQIVEQAAQGIVGLLGK